MTREEIDALGRRRLQCRRCATPCANPPLFDFAGSCPLSPPAWGPADLRVGLGDVFETIAKPIATVLKMDCLDENRRLKPESPCGKRKTSWNKVRLWKGSNV